MQRKTTDSRTIKPSKAELSQKNEDYRASYSNKDYPLFKVHSKLSSIEPRKNQRPGNLMG